MEKWNVWMLEKKIIPIFHRSIIPGEEADRN
jgi:hypothetical protein